ncbi:MAG TPA: hypothetical protein VFQ23_14490, partial [Anaerolineales bacterium]|nr:hypothetical protein [Anaerolineales bacterium]
MPSMIPAIVIPAYNRPDVLSRLLASLALAKFPSDFKVPLVISIDLEQDGPNHGVRTVAESFDWQY